LDSNIRQTEEPVPADGCDCNAPMLQTISEWQVKKTRSYESGVDTIVLTDWGANADNIAVDIRSFTWELMLLSLLYERVLIQDETFVVGSQLPKWFSNTANRRILDEVFDMGTVAILTHPIGAYLDEDLQFLARTSPLTARSEYIARHTTKGDKPFVSTKSQQAFCRFLDPIVSERRGVRIEAGKKREFDIMSAFSDVLTEILGREHYRKWLAAAFSGVSQQMAGDFLRFLENPELAVKRPNKGKELRVVRNENGDIMFGRSLGFQLASWYSPREKNAMQRLIQTCFAAPFCYREKAIGRYNNRGLREPLLVTEEMASELSQPDANLRVESSISVPVDLPLPTEGFGKVIQRVRSSDAGKTLRRSMQLIGSDPLFYVQKQALAAVAEELAVELAKLTHPCKRVNLVSLLCTSGEDVFTGLLADGLLQTMRGSTVHMSDAVISASSISALHGLINLAGKAMYEALRRDLTRQRLRLGLESAVEHRCAEVDISAIVGAGLMTQARKQQRR
jgi:hypothetical protein